MTRFLCVYLFLAFNLSVLVIALGIMINIFNFKKSRVSVLQPQVGYIDLTITQVPFPLPSMW